MEKLNTSHQLPENNPERSEKEEGAELAERIAATSLTAYEILSPTNITEARKAFLSDESMIVPPFEYGKIDKKQIDENIAALKAIYNELEHSTLDGQDALMARILAEKSSKENAFVRDTIDYNSAKTEEEKKRAAETHKFSGEALYGKPDEATFYSMLKSELGAINVDKLSAEDKKLYDSLIQEIGEIKDFNVEPFQPKPETVEKFSEMINALYGDCFKHIPENQTSFTTQEACDIAQEIIREEIGEDATEYRAVMSNATNTCSVSHERREIIFPVERSNGKTFSRLELKKILVHEFGTHAYRAMVFEGDKIPALSSGMAGSEELEEGIAKCCEQAISGKYEISGVEHYINLGLANFKGKNFREVFNIQQKLLYLKGCKADKNESREEREVRFHSEDGRIFTRTMRCFRGTGELPNNKDLVYYNGAMRVWQFIEKNIDDPDLLDKLFLSGKTDILNHDQEQLVYERKVS